MLHRQTLNLADMLFVAMTFVEPGGASDRLRVREAVLNPSSPSDPREALEVLKRRDIDLSRCQGWGIATPDPELEVLTLKKIVRRVQWGSERQLRFSLWDMMNNPPRLKVTGRCLS